MPLSADKQAGFSNAPDHLSNQTRQYYSFDLLTKQSEKPTYLPVVPIKWVVSGLVTQILRILLGIDLQVFDGQNNGRIVQQVEDAEVSPPDAEIVRDASTGSGRTDERVHRAASACLRSCRIPQGEELQFEFRLRYICLESALVG